LVRRDLLGLLRHLVEGPQHPPGKCIARTADQQKSNRQTDGQRGQHLPKLAPKGLLAEPQPDSNRLPIHPMQPVRESYPLSVRESGGTRR